MPLSADTKARFEQEEQAYWRLRDELLKQYAGQWVAIVGGQVVAAGQQMNKVATEALRATGSGPMYVNLVGGEDIVLRARPVSLGQYDRGYTPPLPVPVSS